MKTFVKTLALFLAFVLLFSCVACQKNGDVSNDNIITPDEEEKHPTVVTDHNGNVVALPEKIDRIAVCDIYPLPSVLAVFFDSAEKIVGIPKQSMVAAKNGLLGELYPEILKAEIGYIDGTQLNAEELLKLQPDIAFYSADDKPMGETLKKIGVPAIAISASKWDYDAIETLDNWIALLSEIFPQNDRAEKVHEYSKDIEELVQKRVGNVEEKQKLFFLFQYGENTITTSGKHFFGEWWANAVGGVNVGGEMDSVNSTPVGMEQVLLWNPDRILITNYNTAQPEDLYQNRIGSYDWSEVNAIKNGKVDKMPLGMYRSYTCGVDTPVTLLWLAKTVYPDLFEDVDIIKEAQKYYKNVFDIELTDEQTKQIFAPSSDASAFR